MKKYVRKTAPEICVRLIFYFGYIAAIAGLPYVIKNMIDCDYANGVYDVIKWILMFAALVIIGMISQYITQWVAWKMDRKMYKLLRQDLFTAQILKTPEEFRKKDIGDYSSMLNNDINACQEYVEYVLEILESFLGLFTYAAYIFLLDYRIAAIIYLIAAATLFLPKLTGKKLSRKKQLLLEKTGSYTTKTLDLLKGYPNVCRDTCGPIAARHKRSLDEMEDARYDYGKFKTFTNVLNGSVMYIINTAAVAIIAILLLGGQVTAGVATATIAYIQDFMYPLRTIIDSISSTKSVKGATDAVMRELGSVTMHDTAPAEFLEGIKLDHVSFSYEDFSIQDFSCEFVKGEKYALVGPSGTGKSTLLNLITGNLTPQSGKITVDGKEASRDRCADLMFYANQQPHMFMESFWDNVTLFGSFAADAGQESCLPAKKREYLEDCADCSLLSGGEKELISLERAILSKRSILILDEPFSALDAETEMEVSRKLLGLKDRTVIMITHNEREEYLGLFDEVIQLY